MKLIVPFYEMDTFVTPAVFKKVGEIIWDGDKITTSDPQSNALKFYARTRIKILDEIILPDKEPERFMRALCVAYKRGFAYAGPAVEA
jgi:hypothetical protein